MPPVVVDTIQPLSTATTAALSSNPSLKPDSTTSTQLEHAVAQKVAAEQSVVRARDTSASAAVLGACMPESHYLNGQDKMVQFAGLYVVRGPTESKHVRYTMDVAVAELELRGRCIQRFQSFFLLRKRLLEVLKTCHGRLPVRRSTVIGMSDEPQLSAGAELVEMITRPRCIQCPECESTYNQLAAVKFPRRTWFPPSLQDVQDRSQMLEIFLDNCVRIATTWPACRRSERLFVASLGKFLGVDLRAHIANQKEVGSMVKTRTVIRSENLGEDEDERPEKTESSSEVVYLPSPHEVAEDSTMSDTFEDDCHSEPNFSFISNPSKEDNENGVLDRYQMTIKEAGARVAEPMSAAELAGSVHADGFVALPIATFGPSLAVVELVRTQVMNRYEEFLAEAASQKLDMTLREHSERLPGFYVREGGRIDMQLSTSAFQTRPLTSHSTESVHSVDMDLLKGMAEKWQPVLKELFGRDKYHLEYIGCVVSRPGDGDQNWHLDGVHRNQQVQEPVDRLNVFVPLVAITDKTGGTEMKTKSHIHEDGARGTAFEGYEDLPSVTACVDAGTPIIMDYRVWHRGLANTSESTVRPLLYFKYAKIETPTVVKVPTVGKKRKRITPMLV
ncbi:unnamed protein product [Phytophthora fragariaefolia]|uniref:Unnamed protein product n=1 Tax=Phytophthora fragariaefolia TaxID=1490495 RepID=A0A9W6XFU4_9STRA|nr:unnamed protein product [Phytophthora fragariaefolia]